MSSAESRSLAEQKQIIAMLQAAVRRRSIYGEAWTYVAVPPVTAIGTILLLAALLRIGG